MSSRLVSVLLLVISISALILAPFPLVAVAQEQSVATVVRGQAIASNTTAAAAPQVPRLLRFSGSVPGNEGRTVGVTFALYSNQSGSVPLWQEIQNVAIGSDGRYSVLLGATTAEGMPAELFTTNEARWLGVQVEQEAEQPRVLLVAVPYALKAGDADTLGGVPASAFVRATVVPVARDASSANSPETSTSISVPAVIPQPRAASGSSNFLAKFLNQSDLGNSSIFDSGTAISIGGTDNLGALTFIGNVPFGDAPGIAIYNKGAGAGASVSLDFYNTPFNGGIPQAKIKAVDDGNFSDHLTFSTKVPGNSGLNPVAERLRITSTGNVGIGTTTPGQTLTVAGTVQSTTGGFIFPDGTAQTTAANATLVPFLASTNVFTKDQTINGNLTLTGSSATVTANQVSATNFFSAPTMIAIGTGVSGWVAPAVDNTSISSGTGVFGLYGTNRNGLPNPNATGGTGVLGSNVASNPNSSEAPVGVKGIATGSGLTIGVMGQNDGTDGIGIDAFASATTSPIGSPALPIGIRSRVSSTTGGTGVEIDVNAGNILIGKGAGQQKFSVDSDGNMVLAGSIFSSSFIQSAQNGPGVSSPTPFATPTAVRGQATATSLAVAGVIGSATNSPDGIGVWGANQSIGAPAIGFARGVQGTTDNPSGEGVAGEATSSTGATTGVFGSVLSPSGIAGYFVNQGGGNILVGATAGASHGGTPVFRVDSAGKGFFDGGTQTGGADFAESFAITGEKADYQPGDLLVIDPAGQRRLALSRVPYSTLVAGIYSTRPGVLATPYNTSDGRIAKEVPLAVIGVVPCKVTAENGPIAVGDLLVTSSTPGHAMRGSDRGRMLGAVVGKALEALPSGTGVIQVLVTLQ